MPCQEPACPHSAGPATSCYGLTPAVVVPLARTYSSRFLRLTSAHITSRQLYFVHMDMIWTIVACLHAWVHAPPAVRPSHVAGFREPPLGLIGALTRRGRVKVHQALGLSLSSPRLLHLGLRSGLDNVQSITHQGSLHVLGSLKLLHPHAQ